MNDKINVKLTHKECDLIALALDSMMNRGALNDSDRSQLNALFVRFDTLSSEEERVTPKASKIHLVYDREANIFPLFPK